MAYRIAAIPMTLSDLRTVVQKLTRFQRTWCAARSLYDTWAFCFRPGYTYETRCRPHGT